MLCIGIEFLNGTYRASVDDRDWRPPAEGDWPPSPSRVFSALVAAKGTHNFNGGTTNDSDLERLAQADPPSIYADPQVCWNESLPRFGPGAQAKSGANHFEYPMRTGVALNHAPIASLRTPEVVLCYNDLVLSDSEFASLVQRAQRVGYLGCSDSHIRMSMTTDVADLNIRCLDLDNEDNLWQPAHDANSPVSVSLPVPAPSEVADLDRVYESGLSAGRVRPRKPHCGYLRAQTGAAVRNDGWRLFTVGLERSAPGRHVTRVACALKSAVLSVWSDAPDWVHGHSELQRPFQPGCFVGLPNVFSPHPDSAILGVGVAAPPRASVNEIAGLQRALNQISHLTVAGGRRLEFRRTADRRATLHEHRWRASPNGAKVWATVFPAVSDRHGEITAGSVGRWCDHAGLPQPAETIISRVPILPGAVDMHPSEVVVPRHQPSRKPYRHIQVRFDEPVLGPVVLGSSRTFGLGLCKPLEEQT